MEIAEAVDGRFYLNPVVYREDLDAFFQIESGEAVVAIRRFENTSKRSSRTRVGSAVPALGLRGRVKELRETTRVAFPPRFEGLVDADVWVVEVVAPIPIPGKYDAVLNSPGEHVRFAWNLDFDRAVIAAVMGEGRIDERLMQFALGLSVPGSERERHRAKLRRWLRARVPAGDLPNRVVLSRTKHKT